MSAVVVRSAAAEDAPAVAALVNSHAVSLGLPPDATAEQVAAFWAAPNAEAVVAEVDAEVLAYGDLYVRGDHVQIDVGGPRRELLFAEIEERALRHRQLLRVVLHETDPNCALLAARGFRAIRASYDMAIELAGHLDPPEWPEGIVSRLARDEDRPMFHRVQDEAFADHWGYTSRSYEEWSHLYGEVRPFDRDLWLVAEEGAEPAGIAICERGVEGDRETGWVHVVAVRRPWRGRGLGLALLRWSFRALAGTGSRRAALSVDAENTTGAVRLYERAGMHVTHRFELWEKRL